MNAVVRPMHGSLQTTADCTNSAANNDSRVVAAAAAAAAGQSPHVRLQGLGQTGPRDEGLNVDHGDGYGIGLLGGGSPAHGP